MAEQPVGKRHGLGTLQVGVTRHERGLMRFRQSRAEQTGIPGSPHPAEAECPASTDGNRLPPDRCGCGPCAVCPPPRRSVRPAAARPRYGCPRRFRRRRNLFSTNSFSIALQAIDDLLVFLVSNTSAFCSASPRQSDRAHPASPGADRMAGMC